MAILCVCEDNNKENIPPLSKQANTIEAMSKIPAKRRRRTRYPLEDTTNLFLPPPPPTHSIPISNTTELSVSRLILVRNPRYRKRRVENGPGFSIQMNMALISPRKGFR
ncbi:Serine/threonine-protein kinase [Actinidia chinensis var. chinensis]|uniref:Serine/threonine-protein kinase n=1 Tax=Actinidia chinensis var. chinensis TaxID=1590841 RepID=A0A2R6QA96_ACTCC|nr:Serine/threonine-protein kinase [Actinidia chinensis var. chinensis]